MGYVTAYNPGDSPVVVDDDGRTVGGREWSPVLTTEDRVKEAFADGRLVKVNPPEGDDTLTPEARTAFEATEELERVRREAEPAQVADAAADVGATPTRSARRAQQKAEESQ